MRKIREEPWWDTTRFTSEAEWEAWVEEILFYAATDVARRVVLGGRRHALHLAWPLVSCRTSPGSTASPRAWLPRAS